MSMQKLQSKAALKIAKTPAEVFEAIVDPSQMSNYFFSKSSGSMEAGNTVTWQFPEFDMQFPVKILETTPNSLISFSWADPEGNETVVEITLKPMDDSTFISITEGDREVDEKGITWMRQNTEGWANFLACLKAWLEYGINLRKGAFDISQMPVESSTT